VFVCLRVGSMHIRRIHAYMHIHTCTHAHIHTCTHAHLVDLHTCTRIHAGEISSLHLSKLIMLYGGECSIKLSKRCISCLSACLYHKSN